MKKVRIGIIGTGEIFESHSRGFLLNKDLVDVIAVSAQSYNDESRKRVSKLLGKSESDIQYFTDYNKMLSEAEIDAVDILLPHHLHAPATIASAKKGIHVLVEKPMARNIKECDEMIDACNCNGITLTVCHDRRYSKAWKTIKDILDKGLIGDHIYYRLEHNQNVTFPEGHWVRSKEFLGGGAVMSCLTHQIDALRWYGGEVESVTCMTKTIPSRMEGDLIGIIAAKMKSGALAQLSINWHATSDVSINVVGTCDKAMWFEFIQIIGSAGELYYMHNDGVYIKRYKSHDGQYEFDKKGKVKGFELYYSGKDVFGHNEMITQWIRMLANLDSNILTPGADSRKTVEVAEAAYKAEREGMVVSLPL
jgi:UDP-N-acetyl-2-amino-2-deoxyglucuronate dehydrogenase